MVSVLTAGSVDYVESAEYTYYVNDIETVEDAVMGSPTPRLMYLFTSCLSSADSVASRNMS